MRFSIGCLIFAVLLASCDGGGGSSNDTETPPIAENSGCNGIAYAPGMQELSLTFEGIERTYELHLPTAYNGNDPLPVVLSFHGGGGQAIDQRELTGFEQLGNIRGFITVYPNGILQSWNAADGDEENNLVNDVGFVDALITSIATSYCVDPARVYATGFSNGGRLTQRLGCELADKLAAIAPVSAPMPTILDPICRPARPIPLIEMHGTTDPRSPYEGGSTHAGNQVLSLAETIAGWRTRNGCVGEPQWQTLSAPEGEPEDDVVIESYTQCNNGADVVAYSIIGGGHTWPQGKQYLPELIIGRTSQTFNATEVIWDFFESTR